MAHFPERRSLSRRLKPYFTVFDPALSLILFLLLCVGLVTLSSAGHDFPGRLEGQMRNILAAFVFMWAAAIVPPQTLLRLAVPVYTFGVALLLAVAVAGTVKKGARRWLHVGVDIQPSEIMKIAAPLMLAWYFQTRAGMLQWKSFLVAAVLLAIPFGLIARQPDLGTGLLVGGSGFFVIFLAGLSWKVLGTLVAVVGAAIPFAWPMLHDYQRQRVLTLLDPSQDPLGAGYHIIQSTIAIGSGGMLGKGWLNGTQAQLDFVPERSTDFILAVFGEEFGLVGNIVLMVLYLLIIARGMMITANASTVFSRLAAGAITLTFFTYAFVNMGMVSGILPVVGVPLPMVSYGGTALLSMLAGFGILMSISTHKQLVAS